MLQALAELGIFTAKMTIIAAFILIVLLGFVVLLSKGKEKTKGRLLVKRLNEQYAETKEAVLAEILPKKEFKAFLKTKKAEDKAKESIKAPVKHVYVLDFQGDIKASAVPALSQEITAILNVAKPGDEVLLKLESGGGMVHAYGLAAAQLMRLRAKNIPLVIAIDKIAASGGYMMASIANKILAAPFAIIGSIGVVVQLPNFNRLLKDKHIDFELHTAGEFKRTVTMFGENTDAGREKLRQEIEDIHQHFKNLISEYRKDINIQQVATGEHWIGKHALELKLVDEIKTSDDYLFEKCNDAELIELRYETKKPLLAKLTSAASILQERMFSLY